MQHIASSDRSCDFEVFIALSICHGVHVDFLLVEKTGLPPGSFCEKIKLFIVGIAFGQSKTQKFVTHLFVLLEMKIFTPRRNQVHVAVDCSAQPANSCCARLEQMTERVYGLCFGILLVTQFLRSVTTLLPQWTAPLPQATNHPSGRVSSGVVRTCGKCKSSITS